MLSMWKIIYEYWNHTYTEEINFWNRILYLKEFTKKNIRILLTINYAKLEKTKKYKLVELIPELDCEIEHLFSLTNRLNFINKPKLYLSHENNFKYLEGNSPNINIWMVYDCSAYSQSSAISSISKVYNNFIYKMQPRHDLKNLAGQNIDSFLSRNITFRVIKTSNDDGKSIYIHLLNEHSSNYYHWLFEVMPKCIKIFETISKSETLNKYKYTVLLDCNLPSQFYEILQLYVTINHDIRIVEKYESIKCNKMIYCTDFWISLDNTRFKPNIMKEFFVDRYAVSLIKNKLPKNCIPNVNPSRKIYFERKSSKARSLKNVNELKKVLISEGFEVVQPEKLTFMEQVRLLNEAKIIIGVSGAVFSNIIFMQPKTHAIIFSPKTVAANYYIFQPIADVAEVNLIHILTNNASNIESIHAPASININAVQIVLKSLEN